MYYISYDKYNEAKLILEQCISNDSNDINDSQRQKTLLNYASCLQHENKLDESISIYKTLIEKYKYVDAMHNIANIYKDKKEHEEAIKYYEMAIENGLNISYYSLGLVYLSLNKIDKAIEMFKIGVEKNIIYCMFSLGVYYSVINNEEKMLKYFSMAVNFDDGRNTISKDAIIKLMKYYTKQNNIEKTKYYRNILKEKFPDSYEALIACEDFYRLSQEQ
jgi:tetratricopeptide (TPR) repeat protein